MIFLEILLGLFLVGLFMTIGLPFILFGLFVIILFTVIIIIFTLYLILYFIFGIYYLINVFWKKLKEIFKF